jgi:hypothetical protein
MRTWPQLTSRGNVTGADKRWLSSTRSRSAFRRHRRGSSRAISTPLPAWLAVDQHGWLSTDADQVVLQLPSYELYRDWELTLRVQLTAWPGGPMTPQDQPKFAAAAAAHLRRADWHNYDVQPAAAGTARYLCNCTTWLLVTEVHVE